MSKKLDAVGLVEWGLRQWGAPKSPRPTAADLAILLRAIRAQLAEKKHYVECGPDEVPMPKAAAAVVRAAVRWATGEKYGGSVGLAGDLLRAVERLKERRK